MSESACLEGMVRFATTMVKVFGTESLRELNVIGSLDCMYWKWENYSYAQQGQYKSHHKNSTISFLKQWYHKTYGLGTLSIE